MIKLTLNPGSQTFFFEKEIIIIGEGSSDIVDLSLPGLGLHQTHLKILIREGNFYLINQANDPFVTLNGVPFGKKKLQINDILQIRDKTIRIEAFEIPTPEAKKIEEDLGLKSEIKKENVIHSDFPDIESLANEDDLEGWFPPDLMDITLENIIGKQTSDTNQKIELNAESLSKGKETKFWNRKKWSWTLGFLIVICSIFGIITSEIYFRAKNKSGGEEIKAAESLADFAMAFTYAHVYNIVPQKLNFSDPEFLKNNLLALLSSTSIPCGNIDAQGQFSNCPYLLRFYSNQDLSRFLLIAQPAPSVSQWLFPKDALIIDSSLMTLKKISDLKNINRLLANPNPFEGTNEKDLIETLSLSPVLPLPYLSHATKKREFAPPSILGYIRPGAENLIYNAPRYYQFGETLIKKALSSSSSGQDGAIFLGEVERLLNYENLVFYTSQGMQAALEARRTLSKLVPQNSFFTAYLQLSTQGEILGSRLVLDQEGDEEILPVEKSFGLEKTIEEKTFETLHPALQRVAEFKVKSKDALKPLIETMLATLEEDIEKSEIKIEDVFSAILEMRKGQLQKYQDLLSNLEKEYEDLPEELKVLQNSLKPAAFFHFSELANPFTPINLVMPPFLK